MPFCTGPKTIFGLPLLGLIHPARPPPTRISNGWLSVVPRKFPFVVPGLPPKCQSAMFVKPPPLPLNVPERFTPAALFVITADGSCPRPSVPVTFAAGTELALAAVVALGRINGIRRGRDLLARASGVKLFDPFVLTASASQLLVPVNPLGPKSTSVVNRPLVTATAAW